MLPWLALILDEANDPHHREPRIRGIDRPTTVLILGLIGRDREDERIEDAGADSSGKRRVVHELCPTNAASFPTSLLQQAKVLCIDNSEERGQMEGFGGRLPCSDSSAIASRSCSLFSGTKPQEKGSAKQGRGTRRRGERAGTRERRRRRSSRHPRSTEEKAEFLPKRSVFSKGF
ncbi:hypothetical protein B296_00007220 [Ensete ventricosum]|uniref:Uncharacterized protein n=1 Tax=Ensete ventricosum TaxID=4639 RepID=A0A427AMU9_ENSVE|nr:hypothetical protein B296_00007220 [Ensete ventricosum]